MYGLRYRFFKVFLPTMGIGTSAILFYYILYWFFFDYAKWKSNNDFWLYLVFGFILWLLFSYFIDNRLGKKYQFVSAIISLGFLVAAFLPGDVLRVIFLKVNEKPTIESIGTPRLEELYSVNSYKIDTSNVGIRKIYELSNGGKGADLPKGTWLFIYYACPISSIGDSVPSRYFVGYTFSKQASKQKMIETDIHSAFISFEEDAVSQFKKLQFKIPPYLFIGVNSDSNNYYMEAAQNSSRYDSLHKTNILYPEYSLPKEKLWGQLKYALLSYLFCISFLIVVLFLIRIEIFPERKNI